MYKLFLLLHFLHITYQWLQPGTFVVAYAKFEALSLAEDIGALKTPQVDYSRTYNPSPGQTTGTWEWEPRGDYYTVLGLLLRRAQDKASQYLNSASQIGKTFILSLFVPP